MCTQSLKQAADKPDVRDSKPRPYLSQDACAKQIWQDDPCEREIDGSATCANSLSCICWGWG
jgi:hypothetical protein